MASTIGKLPKSKFAHL